MTPVVQTRQRQNYEIQKRNSEIIAFYFVRIFQILGALLLVVKDFNIPSFNPETGEEVDAPTNNASRNFAKQGYQVVSAFRPPSMKGGARMSFDSSMPLGPYDFLRFYLRQADDDVDIPNFRGVSVDLNKAKEFMFDGSNTMIFEFTPYKDVAEIRADTRPSQKIGILVKNASGMHEKILIPIFIKSIFFDTDSGEEDKIQGYKAPSQRSTNKEKERAYPSRLTLEFVVPGKNSSVNFTRAGPIKGAKDVNLGTEYQFIDDDRKIVEFLVRSDGLSKKRDFVKILERIVMYYVRLSRTDVQAVSFEKKKEEDTTVGKNKPKPPNNKSLKDTFTELMKENYQPHCIARALQLLDSASVSGIKKFDSRMGTTRVCKDGLGGKSSIKLSDYTPTRSFGQLFGKINPLDYQSSINVLKAFAQKDSTGSPLSSDAIGNFPSEKDELEAAIKQLEFEQVFYPELRN